MESQSLWPPLENDGAIQDFVFEEQGILDPPEPVSVDDYIEKNLREAAHSGCTKLDKLRDILRRRRDVFAVNFEECSISDLSPIKPQLKPGATPCRSKPRRMSIEHLKWLRAHVQQMERRDMLKRTLNPVWGIPVFVVPKPGGKGLRMVADFRALNSRSLPSTLPMPLLEQLLHCTHNAKFYASLDNMKGFNLLGTTRSDLFTLVTPFGCYEMQVAPMGYLNSAAVYQDRIVHEVLYDLHEKIVVNWIDDALVFGSTEDEFLDNLDLILSRYAERNVKLNIAKCKLFATKIMWCGRELADGKYAFDPKLYDKVLEMPEPQMASELADFLYSITWLESTLVNAQKPKAVLQEFLQHIYTSKKLKSRKKRLLVGIHLADCGWSTRESVAYAALKQCLYDAIRLAVPNPNKQLCLFTDASSTGCSILVTQTDKVELNKPLLEQKHEIVFITTHRWTDAEYKWHVSSQEAFPIIFAFQRLDFLFAGRKVNIFMDHKNLQYIFRPDEATAKTTLMRLQRWALLIQNNPYRIQHIAGVENIAADLFSRWGLSQRRLARAFVSTRGSRRRRQKKPDAEVTVRGSVQGRSDPDAVKLFHFINSRVSPLWDMYGTKLELPTRRAIMKSQHETSQDVPKEAEKRTSADGLTLYYVNDRIWLPQEMLVRVVTTAHSAYGHPGVNALYAILREEFWSPNMRKCISEFNQRCLNCLSEHMPKTFRRRWGQQIHGTKRNEVLHLDFLYMRHHDYLLVIRDDVSGKTELFYTERADAYTAVDAILWWRARYGLRRDTVIVTDGGSHFANSMVAELLERLQVRHHITVAYSPWSNGKAERVNREILRLFRTMLSELGIDMQRWTSIIHEVQYKLNNTPRERLQGRSSDDFFLVGAGDKPLDILIPKVDPVNPSSRSDYEMTQLDFDDPKYTVYCNELQEQLAQMHDEVIGFQDFLRKAVKSRRKDRVGVQDIQYAIGDYVLVSRSETKKEKLQLTWIGPFQVMDVDSPWVYKVRNIANGSEKMVHACRLRFYEDKYLEEDTELVEQFLRDSRGFEVHALVAHRYNAETLRYQMKVRWWGLEATGDTWVDVYDLMEEVPDEVRKYVHDADATDPVVQAIMTSLD